MNLTQQERQYLQKIAQDPKSWAELFITLPRTNEKFVANHVQKLIFKSKKRKRLVLIHRRGGKCILDTNYIYLSSGERVQAKDLIGKQFKLLTFHEGKQIEVDAYAQYNAFETVYTITTASGRSISRNFEHPLWRGAQETSSIRPLGWSPAGELSIGDYVAAPLKLDYLLEESFLTEEEIIDSAHSFINSFSKVVPDFLYTCSLSQLQLFLSVISTEELTSSSLPIPCQDGEVSSLFLSSDFSLPTLPTFADRPVLISLQHLYLRLGILSEIKDFPDFSSSLILSTIPPLTENCIDGCHWDRVVSIKKSEAFEHTVAITVPGYETFLTDFYEHNTAAAIIYILWKCFTTPNSEVLIIGPGEAQLIKIFNDMDDILYANPLLNADVTGRRAKPLHSREFVNGSKIKAFIAKDGSKSLRGQSGDLIYVEEADFIDSAEWKVIDPIVRGDLNRKPPELLACSTPNVNPKSRFMSMVSAGLDKDVESEFYDENIDTVFVPLDRNPDYTPEMVEDIRKDYLPDRITQYQQEYLCQPVSASELMVFKPHQVQEACALEPWIKDHRYGYSRIITEIPPKVHGEIRTMGVDWDRVQAGPSLLMISYFPGIDHYRVLYREEVDKNIPHLFNYTCDRIIDIHKIAKLDWLYLEATSDVMQVETLQILARQRAPDLYNKIIAVSYNSNYESYDMVTKDKIVRNIKTVIVGQLQNLFENGRIRFPKADGVLLEQLSTYKIMGYTSRGPRYSKANEHFIDALGLACWAMFTKYDNPLSKYMKQGGIMNLARPTDEGSESLKRSSRAFSLGSNFGGSRGRTMPVRDTF